MLWTALILAFAPRAQEVAVTPQSAELRLGWTPSEKENLPALTLSALVGGGMDRTSELGVKKSYVERTLKIEITGAKVRPSKAEIQPAVNVDAKALIPVDLKWLGDSEERTVVFKLQGKESVYTMKRTGFTVTLQETKAGNVSFSEKKRAELILHPKDVMRLEVLGTWPGEDYRDALKALAKKRELEPADEVYAGFPQPEVDCLYVAVRKRALPKEQEKVGSLPVGEGRSDVYLRRILEPIY